MSIYTTTGNVTITCHKRTMPYLEQEVKELGFELEETERELAPRAEPSP
jgi:putative N6-adenine-specific DNA methylase